MLVNAVNEEMQRQMWSLLVSEWHLVVSCNGPVGCCQAIAAVADPDSSRACQQLLNGMCVCRLSTEQLPDTLYVLISSWNVCRAAGTRDRWWLGSWSTGLRSCKHSCAIVTLLHVVVAGQLQATKQQVHDLLFNTACRYYALRKRYSKPKTSPGMYVTPRPRQAVPSACRHLVGFYIRP